jgi:uncharacterized protein (TIGR02300 family)
VAAKPEWGTKRTCQSCGDPFYDLKKKNIECPKCGAAYNPAPPPKTRRPTPSTPKPVEEKPLVPTDEDDGGAESPEAGNDSKDTSASGAADEASENGEDAMIEDTSDLSSGDDYMKEVKEHIDDGVEDKN